MNKHSEPKNFTATSKGLIPQATLDKSKLALIDMHLHLEGEDIIRITTGNIVPVSSHKGLLITVSPIRPGGDNFQIAYYRAKFFLANRYMPKFLDHRDGNRRNNLLSNLRPATAQQNSWNRKHAVRANGLPRGVDPKGKEFAAHITEENRTRKLLGVFATAELASAAVEAFYVVLHGEFYRGRN